MTIRAAAPMARGSLVCSQSHRKLLHFPNNHHHHTFLPLHPPLPSHHNSTRSRPKTTVFIHFEPIGPGPSVSCHHLDLLPVTLRAADSTSTVFSSADKTLIPDDQFSLGKYAELKPVPCLTYFDALQLRETYATPILKQVRNDVTRYRCGDEQHLDEALKRIFQYGQVTEDGKYCLVLVFEASIGLVRFSTETAHIHSRLNSLHSLDRELQLKLQRESKVSMKSDSSPMPTQTHRLRNRV